VADYDLEFPDMEGQANFDLRIRDGEFEGELECKSISVDAGRQIHRKDFYRFTAAAHPLLVWPEQLQRRELVVITLRKRLNASEEATKLLLDVLRQLLCSNLQQLGCADFLITRRPYGEVLRVEPTATSRSDLYEQLKSALGQNIHVEGQVLDSGGYLLAVRSEREDDPSGPLLAAMRKAASQLTATRPGYIAIQEHGIEGLDLLLPHYQRRMEILSSALFGHYGCSHVNSVLVTAFGAFGSRSGQTGVPVIALPNRNPRFPVDGSRAALLQTLSEEELNRALRTPPFRRRLGFT
jgi:hypothetical protein